MQQEVPHADFTVVLKILIGELLPTRTIRWIGGAVAGQSAECVGVQLK
jgi:hypothetical protein